MRRGTCSSSEWYDQLSLLTLTSCVDFDSEEGSSPGTSYEQQFLSNLASIPESPLDMQTIEKQERRLSLKKDGSKDEKAGRKALLQKFMETQMHSVVTSLHHEVTPPLSRQFR
jgi:hypothetical protein